MTYVNITALTFPEGAQAEIEKRFAARKRGVDASQGFQGFELLRPTDGRTTWLVVTRWEDEASFEAWTSGQEFQRAHGGQAAGGPSAAAHAAGQGDAGAPHNAPEGETPRQQPVGMSAELWSFDVAGGSQG